MQKMIQEALRAIDSARDEKTRQIDPAAAAIFIRLGAVSRQVSAFHANVLKTEGLSASEYQLLALVFSLGPQAPRDLNKILLLTSGALTNALDRLQEAGHIRRRPNPEDARSVLVGLTAGGRRQAKRLVVLEMEAQSRQLASLTRAEKREAIDALDQLIDVL
jgi:DNA-binding MarR family transcriptional regulator